MLSQCSPLLCEVERDNHPHLREGMEVERSEVAPRTAKHVRGCDRTRVSGVALLGLEHFLLDQLMGKGGIER